MVGFDRRDFGLNFYPSGHIFYHSRAASPLRPLSYFYPPGLLPLIQRLLRSTLYLTKGSHLHSATVENMCYTTFANLATGDAMLFVVKVVSTLEETWSARRYHVVKRVSLLWPRDKPVADVNLQYILCQVVSTVLKDSYSWVHSWERRNREGVACSYCEKPCNRIDAACSRLLCL